MTGDGDGWAPARPSRQGVGAGGGWASAGPEPARRGDRDPGAQDPDGRQAEHGPVARRYRRASPALRILLAYAALAVAVAVVAVGGTAALPSYGSLTPSAGLAVPDLRSLPRAAGWSSDLAHALAPEAPRACVSLRAGTVDSRHELVTAAPVDRCGQDAAQARGRLVMLDPTTGRTLWHRDLGLDLGLTVDSLVWHSAGGRIVVGLDGAVLTANRFDGGGTATPPQGGTRLVTLEAATGSIVSATDVGDADQAINFGVVGDLVLSVVPDTSGVVTTYWLRRADDLQRVVWTRSVSSSVFPELLPDRLLLPQSPVTVSIDGVTGVASRWGFDLQTTLGARVVGNDVLAVTIPTARGGAGVVLLDARGRPVWRHAALGVIGLAVARDCVVVSSADSDVTCLDRTTGRFRWSTNQPGSISGTPDGSTTADVLSVGPVAQGDDVLQLTLLGSASGRVVSRATLPRAALVVAASRTVGYAVDRSGTKARLIAFDLHDGGRLWTLDDAAIELWGNRFVAISAGGVAREIVGARDPAPHGMLVG